MGSIHTGDPPEVTLPAESMATWVRGLAEDGGERAALVRQGDEFVGRSWETTVDRALSVAGGLLATGVEPGDRVALRARPCYEWSLVDVACLLAGLVVVPVSRSLSPRQTRHVIADSGATVLVTEEPVPDVAVEAVETVVPVEDLPAADPPDSLAGDRRTGDDPATIVYTSGTTGDPKGVVLTHENLLAAVASLSERAPDVGDRVTGFLPFSHIYQRIGNYYAWHQGAAVAYMSTANLAEELPMVRPTTVIAVPRLYERVHDRIEQQVEAGGPKGRLLRWAMGVAREYGRAVADGGSPSRGLAARHAVADRLVFSSLRERIGLDELHFSVTGAARIDPEILSFFWGIDVKLVEGYGATEVVPAAALNSLERFRPGTVGPPAPGMEIRIADDGEILVRGPTVMAGYWNDEAATDAAMDGDWYRTGDVGEFDEAGYLRIEGRKSEIAVLDTGHNVAVETVENLLSRDRLVGDAMAVAHHRKFVAALVQPNFDALVEFARGEGIPFDEDAVERTDGEITAVPRNLLEDDRVQQRYWTVVEAANEDLASYERIKRIELVERAFSIDREELTPTLKKRRSTVAEHFADRIEDLYADS